MERGFEGMFIEEHIPECGTCHPGNRSLLMDAEEVGISAFEPETAGIVFDIPDHRVELAVMK